MFWEFKLSSPITRELTCKIFIVNLKKRAQKAKAITDIKFETANDYINQSSRLAKAQPTALLRREYVPLSITTPNLCHIV